MEYDLREAEEEDIGAIQSQMFQMSETESEKYDPTINPEWCLSQDAEKFIEERIEDSFAYVAEDDGEVIGYALGFVKESEEFRDNIRLAELESMFVIPDYRSNGIGGYFIDEFENWARKEGAERMRVEVTSQNEDGIRFYRSNEFNNYSRIMEKLI